MTEKSHNVADFSKKNMLMKPLREPKKAAAKMAYWLLKPIGHHAFRRFVVVTRDRTGSNMLMQALNSHPSVAADYEIFGRLNGADEGAILARAFGKQPFFIKAKGFKIFYYHPIDQQHTQIWARLQSMKELYIIHLKRRNMLRAAVSSKLASITGIYGVRSVKELEAYESSVAPVAFSAPRLSDIFIQVSQWERMTEQCFKHHPIIDIFYEDMIRDFEFSFNTVTRFIGVHNWSPRTDFWKQGTRSLRSAIANYDELKAGFRGSEWENFFDE